MPARKPEEADLLVIEALNAGDVERALTFYEPDATFVPEPGKAATGLAAIREVLNGFVALKPRLTIEVPAGRRVRRRRTAVLALDAQGHGSGREPGRHGRAGGGGGASASGRDLAVRHRQPLRQYRRVTRRRTPFKPLVS